MSIWPIIILLLAVVGLAYPQLRKVIQEGRQRDIAEREARIEAARHELMGDLPTQGFQAVWDDSRLPPYQYWPEAESETS